MSIIQGCIDELKAILDPFDTKEAIAFDKDAVKDAIEEGKEILDNMKIEIHSISNAQQKAGVQAQMIHYKSIIDKLQKQLLTDGRSERAAGTPAVNTAAARNAESLDILKQARQQLAETQGVAEDTMEHLTKQREQILKTTENTKKVNADLGYSNKLLGNMTKWFRG